VIVVHAFVEVKEGTVQEYTEAAAKCVEATRQEDGNNLYTLYSDTANPLKFVIVEEWDSKAALDAHMQTPHLAEFRGKTKNLLAAPTGVKIYEANAL
jgi:quinol monooxygenase YgiN